MTQRGINYFIGFHLFAHLFITLSASGQATKDQVSLGKATAKQELKDALNGTSQHNVVNHKAIIIKDTLTAINVVEPILFGIYGKRNIIKQRPYETYFIDNYWVISGTLPQDYDGGVFLIIIDSRDSRIIRITHGK